MFLLKVRQTPSHSLVHSQALICPHIHSFALTPSHALTFISSFSCPCMPSHSFICVPAQGQTDALTGGPNHCLCTSYCGGALEDLGGFFFSPSGG